MSLSAGFSSSRCLATYSLAACLFHQTANSTTPKTKQYSSCYSTQVKATKIKTFILKICNLEKRPPVLNREPFLVYQFLLHTRRLIPSNLITPWHFHIPLFYLCELAQKRNGIGYRLALIGENEFVKFTGITPRPFP